MKKFILIAFLFIGQYLLAQAELHIIRAELPNDTLLPRSINFHPSIQPQIKPEQKRQSDSLVVDSIQRNKVSLSVIPLIDGGYRTYKNEYRAMAGIGLSSNIGNKWYGRFSYLQGFENASDRFQLQTVSTLQKDIDLYEKLDLRGRLSYTPNRFINLQAGYDENFIGEGARSLFLSDYGKPYGFGQMRMNFWRIEYLVLYQFMNERLNNKKINKFATTHYLNFSATDWLQFGLFETVVFAPKDIFLNRGFEPEYLNPMIFFRPQEYALGSSDNVLVGLDMAANYKNWTFYSQLLLDEFSLTEIRAKSKWWANKFGIQTGIKGRMNVYNRPLFVRSELNIVRPYTYSHLSLAQSYTNRDGVLAHPLGANFMELLVEAKYQFKKWTAEVLVNYSLKGYDDSFNQGGNIYIPYINRPDDYGHTIGQGNHNNQFILGTKVSYSVLKGGNMQAFVDYQFRANTYLAFLPTHQVIVGIRSNIWNDYRNY
ncbi:MAG: hypothetical protein KJ941_12610 [Bacteroidetes bacterium]|nr:hypothetical protein [Bacteroidota bacterium]